MMRRMLYLQKNFFDDNITLKIFLSSFTIDLKIFDIVYKINVFSKFFTGEIINHQSKVRR